MSLRIWLLQSLLTCVSVAAANQQSGSVNFRNPFTIGILCAIAGYWIISIPILILLYCKCCRKQEFQDTLDMNNRYSHRMPESEGEIDADGRRGGDGRQPRKDGNRRTPQMRDGEPPSSQMGYYDA